MKIPEKTPTLDKLENTTERKRAPLPFFTEQQERAKFDPWKGFKVSHLTTEYVAEPFAGLRLDGCGQFKEPQGKF